MLRGVVRVRASRNSPPDSPHCLAAQALPALGDLSIVTEVALWPGTCQDVGAAIESMGLRAGVGFKFKLRS